MLSEKTKSSSGNTTGEKFYITTPLYYVNGLPHLGHAYATIIADVVARFARQRGKDTLFLTGTDEHGEKLANMAKKEGVPPLEFTTKIALQFQEAWKKLSLSPDIFYRTTQPSHYKLVQAALQALKDKGDIYFASYTGKYCVGCERFRTDQEWNEQGLCPDHLTPPHAREESNYFFKMSKYQKQLVEHFKSHPDAILPSQYMSETLAFLEQPLEDLSISRPKERLEWGIPLPFDANHVTYVWFDALMNYVGALGWNDISATGFKKEYWAEATHVIGRDILKPHAIYWPTMLMALGIPVYKRLQVSGFWMSGGQKMGKSLGNVIDPLEISEKYGVEAFRYYVLREMPYGGDGNFTWETFIQRTNADLANGIGNLASRVLTITHKNCDAKVPSKSSRTAEDLAFLKAIHGAVQAFEDEMETCRYHRAALVFAESVQLADKYINDQKPWALAKDPALKTRLEAVLGTAMDALNTLATLMAPLLPEGAQKLKAALGEGTDLSWSSAAKLLTEGQALGEVPRLYPRLEMPAPATK